MSQARRAVVALISVIAMVLGFAPAAFAQSPAAATTKTESQSPTTSAHAAAVASGPGYWLATQDGGIFSAGSADAHGSAVGVTLSHPIVGIASTPSRNGYWLVASDGGIFSFGDAHFYGSTGAIALNQPIVGMASTPSGHGYWMVASDGGIFSFGDAHFYGSTGNITLNKPITGIASTPTGHGYWMVASDGGVFSFGDAHFYGSTGSIVLNQPIVDMVATPKGHGYWFVAADGGVFSFGDAPFLGSGVDGEHAPVVGMAPSAAAPATKLAFTTQPGDAGAGASLSVQPVVTVQTAGGATATTDSSAVTLALTGPTNANFGCVANPVNTANGVATFGPCGIDQPGTYTLTATDGALTSAVSQSFTIAPGATQLAFTTQPSATATGGTAFATQPVVEVRNALGGRVTTDTSAVALTLTTPNGATLTCTSTTSKAAVAGIATFTGCNIDRNNVAAYTLHATDGGLASATSTGTVVSVGVASQLGFVTQPSTSTVSSVVFASQPHVAVQDAGGNTVTTNTANVVLTLTAANGATLGCSSTTTVAAVNGVATFVGCNVNLANNYTLHAAQAGLVGTSGPVAITPGAATHLVYTVVPIAGVASATLWATQPTVTAEDAAGNAVAATETITLSIPAGATLACSGTNTHTTTGTTGAAAYTGCNITGPAATYVLSATDGALPVITTNVTIV